MESKGGSLKDRAEAFLLFLRGGVQLVLRSSAQYLISMRCMSCSKMLVSIFGSVLSDQNTVTAKYKTQHVYLVLLIMIVALGLRKAPRWKNHPAEE